MNNEQRLRRQISDMTVEISVLSTRIGGLQQIFHSAALSGNAAEMDNLRNQIHAVLDDQLDKVATLYMLSRQLSDITGQQGW